MTKIWIGQISVIQFIQTTASYNRTIRAGGSDRLTPKEISVPFCIWMIISMEEISSLLIKTWLYSHRWGPSAVVWYPSTPAITTASGRFWPVSDVPLQSGSLLTRTSRKRDIRRRGEYFSSCSREPSVQTNMHTSNCEPLPAILLTHLWRRG